MPIMMQIMLLFEKQFVKEVTFHMHCLVLIYDEGEGTSRAIGWSTEGIRVLSVVFEPKLASDNVINMPTNTKNDGFGGFRRDKSFS